MTHLLRLEARRERASRRDRTIPRACPVRSAIALLASLTGVIPSAALCRSGPTEGEDQLLHLTFGDVQWFTLPGNGYGPLAPMPPGPPVANPAPYSDPRPVMDWNADNPPVTGFADHANVTRHWASPPEFAVVIPPEIACGAGCGSPVVDSFPAFAGTLTFQQFQFARGYSWQDWIDDVVATFVAFDGVQTSSISSFFFGVTRADYRLVPQGVPPPVPMDAFHVIPPTFLGAAAFVWSSETSPPNGGPTGNGLNEIILTDQALGGLGITSMIVDPDTGIIQEADVLFDVLGLIAPVGPGLTTLPDEWTALRHEIGHFYGLDHTNLHPGAIGVAPSLTLPPGIVVACPGGEPSRIVGSIADFPAGPLDVTGAVVVPGMVGVITHLGLGFDHVAAPMHPDDAVSLSKVYPVCVPSQPDGSPQKLPLINVSARILGRFRDSLEGMGGVPPGSFGRNVWVAPEGAAGNLAGIFPTHGVLTGTARLSATDGAFLPSYTRTASHVLPPCASTVNGSLAGPFFEEISVVGASTVAGQIAPEADVVTSGDFSLEGLPAGTFEDSGSVAHEVVFEDAAYLGAGVLNQSEWFQEFLFYTGNPIVPLILAPSGAATMSIVVRNAFGFRGGEVPGSFTTSGMRVVPGTVIALDPRELDACVIRTTGACVEPDVSINGASFMEWNGDAGVGGDGYLRPLVDIQPRTGRWNDDLIVVRMKPTLPQLPTSPSLDFEIAPNQSSVFVNNVFVGTVLQIFQSNQTGNPIFPGSTFAGNAQLLRMRIPMASLLARPEAQVPPSQCPAGSIPGVRLTVMAALRVINVDPTDPIQPDNSRLSFGRNDVIY